MLLSCVAFGVDISLHPSPCRSVRRHATATRQIWAQVYRVLLARCRYTDPWLTPELRDLRRALAVLPAGPRGGEPVWGDDGRPSADVFRDESSTWR
jgi:hypothetical protein